MSHLTDSSETPTHTCGGVCSGWDQAHRPAGFATREASCLGYCCKPKDHRGHHWCRNCNDSEPTESESSSSTAEDLQGGTAGLATEAGVPAADHDAEDLQIFLGLRLGEERAELLREAESNVKGNLNIWKR